ncbi:hypothetical protein [Leucobacter sp. wl10]|uniref:hypothetical protein n=1 Tax=Leucobacter sp. wl10 TaxID=2304677 RepID=UPI0013C37234|nr:hypothetical protein [Leucobacter sp. wl10]
MERQSCGERAGAEQQLFDIGEPDSGVLGDRYERSTPGVASSETTSIADTVKWAYLPGIDALEA